MSRSRTAWQRVLVLILCAGAYTQANAQAPRPDPELEVTADMQERFKLACKTGVQSIDARYRPSPASTEYAYVDCVPFKDEDGRAIGPVVYCERNASHSWSCREHRTNVRTILAGKPLVFSYAYSTLEQSLEVLRFLLASNQLQNLVPPQWASSELSVHRGQGRFLVGGHAGSARYSFEVRESPGGKAPFEVMEVFQCQDDTCQPIWSASK